MKIVKTLISVFILVLLLFLGLYSFFRNDQVEISEIEKRLLNTNVNLLEYSIFSNYFTNTFENIIADQFYNRYYFVNMKNKLNFKFIDIVLSQKDNPLSLSRIGDSPIYRIGNSNYLTPFPILYDEVIEERLIDRANQINQLAEDYSTVKFFVYKPTQIFETSFFDQANGIESAGKIYDQILKDYLNVPYDSFEFYTFSDYPKYQYFSDHHWNHEGIDRGYREIVELMKGADEETLEPQEENCFNGLKFSGTYTSLSGFITEGAPFCVYRYNLPEYIYWVNGEFVYDIHDTNAFFHMDIKDDKANLYENAYGFGSGLVEVKSNSSQDENLLIIGDSYAPAIIPLLAKHYNHIFLVNPLRYAQVYGKDFTYDDFIVNNAIENVLFMYVIENYYASDEWGERYKSFDIHRSEESINVIQ